MRPIRLAIAGVGNCASSLVQGLSATQFETTPVGGYTLSDIEVAAAFDIDERKAGRPLAEAIFAPPNCTKIFCTEIRSGNLLVSRAPTMDGVAEHMASFPGRLAFRESSLPAIEVASVLKEKKIDVLVCYLPVGSEKGVRYYADACLEAGVAMVNCVPVFIASDPAYQQRFLQAGIPLVGDDIKSQVGATILHRTLARLIEKRGGVLSKTYQLNVGGNTDFLNMLDRDRLKSKKVSKTESVQSQLNAVLDDDNIHIGPSDYVPWLKDNKVGYIRLEWSGWGGIPMNLEMRLDVEDSANSAPMVATAIRCAKLALDRGQGGVLDAVSAYAMKRPPLQLDDDSAQRELLGFLS